MDDAQPKPNKTNRSVHSSHYWSLLPLLLLLLVLESSIPDHLVKSNQSQREIEREKNRIQIAIVATHIKPDKAMKNEDIDERQSTSMRNTLWANAIAVFDFNSQNQQTHTHSRNAMKPNTLCLFMLVFNSTISPISRKADECGCIKTFQFNSFGC